MSYLKKYRYIILISLLIIIFFFWLFNRDNKNVEMVTDLTLEIKEEPVVEKINNEKIKIDIKGAVEKPGVYELDSNSRVDDAIKISGGLTKEADTSVINLSKNLTDEMVIIIYTKEEVAEMKSGSTSIKYIEKECICPKIENDACIDNVIDNTPTKSDEVSSSDGKISLNNATVEELMQLPGIGEVKAKAIIAYREGNGGFKAIEELLEVNGIGESTFNKIKDQLSL